jgi:hypothetical protein
MKHAWLLVVCVACSRDIRLGGGEGPDAAVAPFIAGSYMTSFLGPEQSMCTGTLSGHEGDFASITPASVGLVDGSVSLTADTSHLVLAGAPIQSGFSQVSVMLVPDPNSGQPAVWDNAVSGSFGAGPDATQVIAVGLAVDSSTAMASSGIEGEYIRDYATNDALGDCSVAFGALLVIQ